MAPYYKTYGGARNRWGDYSATSLDPVDQADFWVVQEYAEVPANTWSTWWAYVKVAYVPVADFEADNVVVPTGEQISFKDLTKGIPSQWEWYFEGAEPEMSTDQNPANIRYDNEGTFDVKLIVTNDLGSDTIIKNDYITVSSTVLPDVDFSASQVAICTGEPVRFYDSTLYMPVTWEWEFYPSTVTFEEGTDSYSQNPVVSFDAPGSYTVKLTASNINGTSEVTKFDYVLAGGFNPYFHENFENGFDKNYWMIEDVEPEQEYGRTWEMSETGYYSDHSASIRFTDYIYWGHRDRLITPAFNLEGMSNATLEFKHAYAKRLDDATDSLIVLISDDCGNSWTRLAAYGDDGNGSFATSPQTDTTKFWKPETPADWCGQGYGSDCKSIDISQWTGKSNVRIAFESFNFFGNALYLDNVTIEQYTGVTEQPGGSEEDLLIFPNPAKNFVTFSWAEGKVVSVIEIYTASGKLWKKLDLSNEHLGKWTANVAGWPKGVYFINLKGDVNKAVNKLIVY
jgi:PKD repeat protein